MKDKVIVMLGDPVETDIIRQFADRMKTELISLCNYEILSSLDSNTTSSAKETPSLTMADIENAVARLDSCLKESMFSSMPKSMLLPIGMRVITSPRMEVKKQKQIRFPRSKKKRIRKKFFKRWMRTVMVPADYGYLMGDKFIVHPDAMKDMRLKGDF